MNKGRHNFDRIRFDYYRDETVAVEALKAGEYDARQENISRIWATAYDTPATKSGLLIRKEIFHEQPAGMQGFVFNTRRAKLSDPALREAMNLAFDFEWENKVLFYGAYRRTTSYFMNSPFEAKGIPTGAELALLTPYRAQLPARLFTEPFAVPATDGSGNNRANLLKAKAILEEAGWKVKDRLLRIPGTDTPLEIEFLIDSGSFERVISPYIATLARLGITARLRIIDSAQYQRRLDDFDFDVIVNTFGVSLSPGNEQTDFWHSSRVDMPGTKNLAGVKSPVVDALVEKIIRAATYEEMESAAKALDRVLLWGYYVVPNWYNNSFRMIYWDKFGQPAQQAKYALGLTDCWWIDPEKQKRVDAARSQTSGVKH
ncbi:MAG: ABC transporter substrate-binding protein [Alphaproteobacteria bacterium]|nr:ABC transporter substrate-binding protein [Alphaproteobacteria bacterium]